MPSQQPEENKTPLGERVKSPLRAVGAFFGYVIRKLPIVSGLPDATLSNHQEALKETATTVILATVPLWLGAFLAALLDTTAVVTGNLTFFSVLLDKLEQAAESGALIIYSASLVAPVVYMALNDRDEDRISSPFPSKISHVLAVLIVTVISTGYFTADMLKENLNSSVSYYTSLWLFSGTVCVLYIASCYRHLIDGFNFEAKLSRQSKGLTSQLGRARG